MQATTIRVVDAAKMPLQPSSPRRKIAGGVGLALGSLFGVGLAFYRERNDKIFRSPGDIPRQLNVKELGVIPKAARSRTPSAAFALSTSSGEANVIALTRWGDNFSIAAEAYRNITFSILLANSNKRCKNYVITSPGAGEGKTTVASNLGVALSKSRLRVVLVDGDLRRPTLHQAFAIDNHFGLRDILRGEIDLESVPAEILATQTQFSNVSIIAAGEGKEDVVELLHSPHFGALLARLSRDFDVVLIDTPPILHMADARILAGQSDGALLVCRAGTTSHDEAANARDILDHDGVRLVGTILNAYEQADNYYGSYFKYHDAAEGNDVVGAAR